MEGECRMYAQAYGGQAPSFFHREVYNLIMEAREILTKFKNNEISLEEAEHYFRKEPFEEMGEYAKLDSHREIRNGFPEVIFCSRKADEHFVQIFRRLYEDNGEVLGTRASRHQYELVKDLVPGGGAKRERKERTDRGLHRGNSGHLCGGRSRPDGGIFRLQSRTDL